MAQAALVNEKFDAGAALVRAADKAQVPLRAALWVYDGSEDRWRLALEATSSPSIGPLEFSQALHRAVDLIADDDERDRVRDLLLEDVELFTRPSPMAQQLRPQLGTARSVFRTRLQGAVLYRLELSQAI
jgi:hypothetical protein